MRNDGEYALSGQRTRLRGLKLRIWVTWAGILTERVAQAFWPAWSAALLGYAAYAFVPVALLPPVAVAGLLLSGAALFAATLVYGLTGFRFPGVSVALDRLDKSHPGRPISALLDRQSTGILDDGSVAVWNRHMERMSQAASKVRAVPPDLRLSRRDRFSVRYLAAAAFVCAIIFAPDREVFLATDAAANAAMPAIQFEAWLEPPLYTGKRSIYLNDLSEQVIPAPIGSLIPIRIYGEADGLEIRQTVDDIAGASGGEGTRREVKVRNNGSLMIGGPAAEDVRVWKFFAIPDKPPSIKISGPLQAEAMGSVTLPLSLQDDYGVEDASIRISLDIDRIDRRYGLQVEPERVDDADYPVLLPFADSRQEFEAEFAGNFAKHRWAGLPVRMKATAIDGAGQHDISIVPLETLPGRRFFDPMAAALVEQRRDLLWSRKNGARVARVLRAITHNPEDAMDDIGAYLMIRNSIHRLEASGTETIGSNMRDQVAEMLWQVAVRLEEGDLAPLRERMREVGERLSQALQDNRPQEEIDALMREYMEALGAFMEAMASNAAEAPDNLREFSELREVEDSRIGDAVSELEQAIREGRLDDAASLLDQLRSVTENMMAMSQEQRENSDQLRETMEGLADTFRQQQGLSDEAYRELSERRAAGQAGSSPGNSGYSGGLGSGEDHFATGEWGSANRELAERQESIRQGLRQQLSNLEGLGNSRNLDAFMSFDQAVRSMSLAREGLSAGELEDALSDQAVAIDKLAEGIRALGEELSSQAGTDADGENYVMPTTDPLGRGAGSLTTDDNLVPESLSQRRSRELRNEIQQRSGEQFRPPAEIDYLLRLLERF